MLDIEEKIEELYEAAKRRFDFETCRRILCSLHQMRLEKGESVESAKGLTATDVDKQ